MKSRPKKTPLGTFAAALAFSTTAPGALWIDFNSEQSGGGAPVAGDPTNSLIPVHNEPGYQSYHVAHESAPHLSPATPGVYSTTFALTGAANVSLLPAWPNSSAVTVRQSIGRTDGQANTWVGSNQALLRDWIGTDSRTSVSGNGVWDGTTGTPTYMTLTLGGLPAALYDITTFHHDVENMNSFFTIEVSTDGGSTYGNLINGRMTNSTAGGTPADNEIFPETPPNVAGGDPADLSSTQNFMFAATGDDVVLRFAPLGPETEPVHQMFFGINGLELNQVPEPTTAILSLLGAGLFLRRRRS